MSLWQGVAIRKLCIWGQIKYASKHGLKIRLLPDGSCVGQTERRVTVLDKIGESQVLLDPVPIAVIFFFFFFFLF
jgi:hypothetical protein